MKKLLVIDGHALIHRAYHALPPLRTKQGLPTNAIYGFFSMMYLAIQNMKPDYLMIAFDTPTQTFRKKLYDGYQGKRPEPEEDLVQQFNLIKELLDAAGIARLEAPGYEADDVIGTIATKFATKDVHVEILTGDKDILQLVNDNVTVIMPKIGLSQTIPYNEEAVFNKLFVKPTQIPDYKALSGDPSDNYQGVPGLGPKTAVQLINQFGSVENMYEKIDEVANPKLKQKLLDHKDTVTLLKHIATIEKNTPVEINFEKSEVLPYPVTLKETMERYEFNSLKKRYFPEAVEDSTGKPISSTPAPKKEQKPKDPSQMDLF